VGLTLQGLGLGLVLLLLLLSTLTLALTLTPTLSLTPLTLSLSLSQSTYEYVAECSNRGLCDAAALGTCTCFPGYTSDACSEQSSLSL
jgi:hypothetical protein